MEPTLKKFYKEQVAPKLKERLELKNVHQIPKIEKVVLNCGFGKQADRKQAMEDVVRDLAAITGQRPITTKARKSVANFKLREGETIGAKVTLRGDQMWEFLERLIKTAIPVIRDFRGVSAKSFDGRGNYALGINDQTIFPELDLDQIQRPLGFDICIVTTSDNDDHARVLLEELGMPFRKPQKKETAA
ncbi:MAG: 50S ribosomal protein L5 [Verrucomicrobiales bacterium]|nr:50S ribosomal protein L5 [Verrucomicrobiae bacterium]